MCFGGSKSTNNTNVPAYAATPDAGAAAVQQDRVASPKTDTTVPGLSDQPTQFDITKTGTPVATSVGLNVKGMR